MESEMKYPNELLKHAAAAELARSGFSRTERGSEGKVASEIVPSSLTVAEFAGGEAAALRLDKRTYLDREQGHFRVTLRDYGDGFCEMGWSFVPNLQPFKSARGESEQRDIHEDRAGRRARSRLRQLILSANADHLLTLTYRDNVTT